MIQPSSSDVFRGIEDLLVRARGNGVRLWSQNGQLHYEAPADALTQEDLRSLKERKAEVLALLERRQQTHVAQLPDAIPLTYSQLAHWQVYRLAERHHLREIAFATRLSGRLDVGLLRESLAENIRRQEALRTRIVYDGMPMQRVEQSRHSDLIIEDLRMLPVGGRDREIQRFIQEHVGESIDVTRDPLLAVKLLKLSDHEHVLIVAMEHIISDGYSRNLLLRDVLAAYAQLANGKDTVALPNIGMTLADYAIQQKKFEESWVRKHGSYWELRLRGCERLRFPGEVAADRTQLGWGIVPLRIEPQLTKKLREWCRSMQTTLVMGIFSAYVALVLRWCDAREAMIRFQSNGRVSPALENTVGYFAFALHLRIELASNDTFIDLLNQVTREYCAAYEHTDESYIESRVPRPDIVQSTAFNWLPRRAKSEHPIANDSSESIVSTPIPFLHPVLRVLDWDCEPVVALFDTDEEIVGRVAYPRSRFSAEAMERFSRSFLHVLESVVARPEERVRDLSLPH